MSFFVMLSLSVCLLTPMEPAVNDEKWALEMIQELKELSKSLPEFFSLLYIRTYAVGRN